MEAFLTALIVIGYIYIKEFVPTKKDTSPTFEEWDSKNNINKDN